MYQWTHKEQTQTQPAPGKLETGVVWPHAKASPIKNREGESKIPKLLASTPKARIQLISSIVTLTDPQTALNGNDNDKSKVNELKAKIGKCETVQEMFMLMKGSISEYSMQSSESSSNSGIFTNSMLNGADSTVFDRSMETTVFNVLRHRPESSPVVSKTPPKGRTTVKSRTSPSTPTGTTSRPDPKRFRRNLSVESVNSAAKASESAGCKKCAQQLTAPKKNVVKRMVDKATVMDVEPLELMKTTNSTETQTEPDIKEEEEIKKEPVSSAPAPAPPPPPPPMMMNIPPPPPLPAPGGSIPGKDLAQMSI